MVPDQPERRGDVEDRIALQLALDETSDAQENGALNAPANHRHGRSIEVRWMASGDVACRVNLPNTWFTVAEIQNVIQRELNMSVDSQELFVSGCDVMVRGGVASLNASSPGLQVQLMHSNPPPPDYLVRLCCGDGPIPEYMKYSLESNDIWCTLCHKWCDRKPQHGMGRDHERNVMLHTARL